MSRKIKKTNNDTYFEIIPLNKENKYHKKTE